MTTEQHQDDIEITLRVHLRGVISDIELAERGETLREYVEGYLLEADYLIDLIDGSIPGHDAEILDVKRWPVS